MLAKNYIYWLLEVLTEIKYSWLLFLREAFKVFTMIVKCRSLNFFIGNLSKKVYFSALQGQCSTVY